MNKGKMITEPSHDHALGAQHPKGSGASSGIMAYPPQQPNQSDINNLMNNNILKDVFK